MYSQGSILESFSFLLCVNDLLECLYRGFLAENANLTSKGSIADIEIAVNFKLANLKNWLAANKIRLNGAKSEVIKAQIKTNENSFFHQIF